MKSAVVWLVSLTLIAGSCGVAAQETTKPKGNRRSPPASRVSRDEGPLPADSTSADELRGPRNRPAPPRLGEPINDKAIFRYLEAEGIKMVHAGRTLTNWPAQFDHRSCRLAVTAPGKRKLTATEVAEQAERGVVIVGTYYLCEKCSNLHLATASGFFLNNAGAMATSRHVLGSAKEKVRGIVALTRDGRLCAVREILAIDPLNDLAVLQLEGRDFQPLALAADAPVGSLVSVMSHPENHFYMLTTGIVSRYSVLRRKAGLASFMTVTADFAGGSSGAPVLDEFGAVVGMVNNTQSIYYGERRGVPQDLQMVVKDCVPSRPLLELIQGK